MQEKMNMERDEIIIASWLHNIVFYAKDDSVLTKNGRKSWK